MSRKTLLAIGEAMLEFSGDGAGGWRQGFAGDTLNTAWYARALLDRGKWDVEYLTRLGRDRYSDRMAGFMADNGIGTAHIQRDEARRPGLYLIELEAGERSFTYWRENSAARRLADDEPALARAMAGADAIYLSGITLAILSPDRRALLIQLLAAATRRGALTAFDPNIRPALWENAAAIRENLTRAAAAAALVLPSFDDEARAFGDASPEATAARYRAAGSGEVVVKNGGAPTFLSWADQTRTVAPPRIAEPVDTTGAGDSFNGGYLAARLSGRPPEEAAREGHRVAGIVVGRHGAIIPQADVAVSRTGAG
ncbi:MAG TPA: sugar kinase [Paracoccaceae bacterium]|nr:sugar kinase [Paracoccaceae bacterium]